MLPETYGNSLKKLITFTQAKFISLASIVGYDVSYVNKWSNGSKLPSSRYIIRINEELGKYFADTIKESGREDEFYQSFGITPNDADLHVSITNYLCTSYRRTIGRSRVNKEKERENQSTLQVILGHHDTTVFLPDILQKGLESLTEDGELLVFGEFITLYNAGFWDYFSHITLHKKLTIRVGIDLDLLEASRENIRHLYSIINQNLSIDFVLYDSKDMAKSNLILLKGMFAIQYSLSAHRKAFNMCTYIYDEATVMNIYETFYFVNDKISPLMFPVTTLGLEQLGYRTSFYATNKYFFFLAIGMEFILPHDVFDSMTANLPPEQAFPIKRLCVTWEEIINQSDITFIVPMPSLMRYAESGYIYLTDYEYNLSVDERKAHIGTFIQGMEHNPRITLGIFSPTATDSDYLINDISFYSNYKTGFLKKNKRKIRNNADNFYILSDKRLHDIVLQGFQHLKESSSYKEYTPEALKKIYETYKPLIERTIDLLKA